MKGEKRTMQIKENTKIAKNKKDLNNNNRNNTSSLSGYDCNFNHFSNNKY